MRQKKLLLILALLCSFAQGAWADEWAGVYSLTQTTSANWTALNSGTTNGYVLGASGKTTYYYVNYGNLSFTNNQKDNGGGFGGGEFTGIISVNGSGSLKRTQLTLQI